VGLVALELERRGVATVAFQLLHAAAAATRPPRALWVPFWHGYALGAPGDAAGQRAVLEAAFALLEDDSRGGPVLRDYRPVAADGAAGQSPR
jgi:hypothetical protein